MRTVNPVEDRQQRIRRPYCIDATIVKETTGDIAGKCVGQIIRRTFRQIEPGVGRELTEIQAPEVDGCTPGKYGRFDLGEGARTAGDLVESVVKEVAQEIYEIIMVRELEPSTVFVLDDRASADVPGTGSLLWI